MTKTTQSNDKVRLSKGLGTPGRMLAACALALATAGVLAAGAAGFLGRVAVEWDDTDLFNRHRLVLLTDFGFEDATGKQWIARKGTTLDGASFPPLFAQLVGLPFVGEHRRAGILHDYFSQQLTHDWKQVRRMYYEALLAEGQGIAEAKTAYAVLYGVGMRWEVKGSSCYVNCHGSATALRWIPDVTEGELEPVFELLNEGNPSLDEIDRAVEAAVPKPGPHLFSQLRPEENGAPSREAQPNTRVHDADEDDGSAAIAPATDSAEPEAVGGAAAETESAAPDVAGPADPEPAHATSSESAPVQAKPGRAKSGDLEAPAAGEPLADTLPEDAK